MSRSGKKRKKHQLLETTSLHDDSGAAAAGRVAHAHEPARPNASFGAVLLHARTQRGISHDDVARDTRVAKRYVLALENESFSSLPGGLYNRAYVRTYAAYLGLDADVIVRDYDRTAQERGTTGSAAQPDEIDALRAVIQKKESQRPGRRAAVGVFKGPLVASTALVVLAGGGWAGGRYLSYPAAMMPSLLRSADPAVSDTGGISGDVSGTATAQVPAQSEIRASEPAKEEPDRFDAAPVGTSLGQTPETRPEARQATTSISVNDSGVGTDVVGRELVGRSETFAAGARIVFWTLVTGGQAGDTIRHTWVHRGRTVATVKLPVSGATWRTYSQRMLAPGTDGEWVVEAQDDGGRVLARHAFIAMVHTSEARSPQP